MEVSGAPEPDNAQKPTARPRSWAARAAAALALVGLAAFVYVVFSALSKPDSSAWAPYAVGAMRKFEVAVDAPPQPQRTFMDAEGRQVSLGGMDGAAVLVNLWQTRCAPCLEEMPSLARLQASLAPSGVRVVVVSIDQPREREAARALLARLSGGALDFYHDPTGAIAYDLKARGLPTSIVYDRHGREIGRLAGRADWDTPEARALLQAVAET